MAPLLIIRLHTPAIRRRAARPPYPAIGSTGDVGDWSVCPSMPAGGPALLLALLAYADPDVACLQETGSLLADAVGGLPYR